MTKPLAGPQGTGHTASGTQNVSVRLLTPALSSNEEEREKERPWNRKSQIINRKSQMASPLRRLIGPSLVAAPGDRRAPLKTEDRGEVGARLSPVAAKSGRYVAQTALSAVSPTASRRAHELTKSVTRNKHPRPPRLSQVGYLRTSRLGSRLGSLRYYARCHGCATPRVASPWSSISNGRRNKLACQTARALRRARSSLRPVARRPRLCDMRRRRCIR